MIECMRNRAGKEKRDVHRKAERKRQEDVEGKQEAVREGVRRGQAKQDRQHFFVFLLRTVGESTGTTKV